LDLLQLCFEFDVFFLGVVICDLQVSVVVLKILFLRFRKESLSRWGLMFVAENHLSAKLLSLEVVEGWRGTLIHSLRDELLLAVAATESTLRNCTSLERLVLLHGILLLELRVNHVVLL
jgi:hypothetical protein